jgi:hypothetical protein
MRRMTSFPALLLAALLGLSGLCGLASAQVPGVSREQMWYAPTEEDWRKPVLIEFQRTWEDALAVAEETGKPILICVNMDGEIASEHYAGIRYRMPEIAKLYEPYVCVIASTYRHTPRDHDEQGHRIECPRFGSVTCGEHIAIEPILFEKYFDGQRVAPRHIMVELNGKETYDVFYAFDTDSVFKAISDGIANRKDKPKPIVKGDRSLVEKVKSRDQGDRKEVETAYQKGDRALKRSLMEAALQLGSEAPPELLRMAVLGFDENMSALARKALAQANNEEAVALISEALRVPLDEPEREALVKALDRIGKKSERARTMAAAQRGLGGKSKTVDVSAWTSSLEGAAYRPALTSEQAATSLKEMDQAFAAKDAGPKLELAEAFLVEAEAKSKSPAPDRTIVNALLEDSRRAARAAEAAGAEGWRVNMLLAVSEWYLGQPEEARRHAVLAAAHRPDDAKDWKAMVVLGLFADERRAGIRKALKAKTDWPKSWLTDVHAAYRVLAGHPDGTAAQVVAHYDFLLELDAKGEAARTLQAGIQRFPADNVLHNRLRVRALVDRGAQGLEDTYAALLKKEDAAIDLHWFAGYASIVAAEYQRKNRKRRAALEAYGRAIAHYDDFIAADPDRRASADTFAALALGARARVHYERRANEEALADLIAAFERSPDTANKLDGLNLSAVDTAKMLKSRFQRLKKKNLEAELQAALDALDPAMLRLPGYEFGPPK